MREFTFQSRITGPLKVTAIFVDREGVWEGHAELQVALAAMARFFTVVDEGTWNHAKAGHTAPLVKALSVPPEIVLRRFVPELSACEFIRECPLSHGVNCRLGSGAVPECFMAPGPEDSDLKAQLHQLVWSLLGGSYLVIVRRGVGVV